jgi:hypothetical protein
MDALISLISPFWGWIGGAAAIAIGLLGAYFKVKSTGKAEERQARDAEAYVQQEAARIAARENEIETSLKSDRDITAGLIRDWVRNPEEGAGRD